MNKGFILVLLSLVLLSSCKLFNAPTEQKVHTLSPGEKAKRNSEILQEMIRVVRLEEPESAEFFGGLVNSLNQGASVEGIYNGLIHNPLYRSKEETGALASARAVDFFIDQMFLFQKEALQHTKRSELIATFKSSTLFRLKRILGDEALKFMREFPDHTSLAYWYAGWAVSMCDYKINFGLKQRNNPDLIFHREWALRSSRDSLDWEVLNRLHRGLNL